MKEGIRQLLRSKSAMFAVACWCFLLAIACISVVDASIFFPTKTSDRVEYYASQKAELIGYIATEPDDRIDSIRYIVETEKINGTPVRGRVYFKHPRYPQWQYGERVRVQCTLKIPGPIVDKTDPDKVFHYDKYLALSDVYAICEFPRVETLAGNAGDPVYAFILKLKKKVAATIHNLWPEPYASFMAGLLYGYRGGLGALNEAFSITGVTHIVAVSGFNISVIAAILINICVGLSIPRQKSFWLVMFGIVSFVIFTGASASVVRAGIMGILTLLASYVGRSKRIGNVLLLTAVTMALHNPLVLWFDAGFQLSFLSTLGLVYLAPKLKPYLRGVPDFLGLRENLNSTLSAIFATIPIILIQFGRFSVVAPVVNILILWIIPWLMLSGALAVGAAFIYWPLGQAAAWFGWIGMRYVVEIVGWFARLPWAAVTI